MTVNLNTFLQGLHPPTLTNDFTDATSKFADVYLNSVKDYYQLLATIYFLTHHPAVNEQILDYSITITLVHRDDTSLEVANPLEVHLLSY